MANHAKIQNVRQPLKVMGLGQIPQGSEIASAILEKRGEDYFIHLATFQAKVEKRSPLNPIGVDLGIDKQLTLSNGLDIKEGIPQTKRIRSIHRELSRRSPRCKNWRKSLRKLNREFSRIGSRKKDIRNKIASRLVSTYGTIVIQDDNIRGWQKMWGRRVEMSAIGGIMGALRERAHTLIEVPRRLPTTKRCSQCGAIREISLRQRTYRCLGCGYQVDRNLNSAFNILNEGVPAERRELTPVDTKTATGMMEYLNSIPGVSASLVVEASG